MIPAIRHTIPSLVALKGEYFYHLDNISKESKSLGALMEEILSHSPLNIRFDYGTYDTNAQEKYIDQVMWRYLVRLFDLHKYMLGSEFSKLQKDIDHFNFPVFNEENAASWVEGLKSLILDNVNHLIKQVYHSITSGCYYTGKIKKKRNNLGIDKTFILHTRDYQNVFAWYNQHPTVTDDLEKVCYLFDGENVPQANLKSVMRSNKSLVGENSYMKIIIRKNGNTQFTLADSIRDKLNSFGPEDRSLGQDLKIKIFENTWQ